MALSQDLILHLYRRAGFGAEAAEIERAQSDGWAATVTRLVHALHHPERYANVIAPPQFAPLSVEGLSTSSTLRSTEFLALTNWWIEMMSASQAPLLEKLVLLYHCQFPTGYSKVNRPSLMYQQNQLFRQSGMGTFTDLALAVARDPSMLIWLDSQSNIAAHPNENFARELMERFAMGVGHYSEDDVKAAARCFTGWTLNNVTGAFSYNITEHDVGQKTLLGRSGPLTGSQAVEIICRTEASARWVVSRFFSWLAYPVSPRGSEVTDLLPVFLGHRKMVPLIEAILNHPAFVSEKATTGLIKQPIEWVVGTLRALHLSPADFPSGYIANILAELGQRLFDPPTVGGWGDNTYWLSSATSLVQLKFAQTVASTTKNLGEISSGSGRRRLHDTARLLGVSSWSHGTATALQAASNTPTRLLTLALVSPEYLAN